MNLKTQALWGDFTSGLRFALCNPPVCMKIEILLPKILWGGTQEDKLSYRRRSPVQQASYLAFRQIG